MARLDAAPFPAKSTTPRPDTSPSIASVIRETGSLSVSVMFILSWWPTGLRQTQWARLPTTSGVRETEISRNDGHQSSHRWSGEVKNAQHRSTSASTCQIEWKTYLRDRTPLPYFGAVSAGP